MSHQYFLVVFESPDYEIDEDDLNAVIGASLRGTWANIRGWSVFKRRRIVTRKSVAESLAYALSSTFPKERDEGTVMRLIVSEFWHALNRRGFANDAVDPSITYTYEKLKEWQGLIPRINKFISESMQKGLTE